MLQPPYDRLTFEPAPPDRPTVCINMVSTIDGKTVTGGRDEAVMDLGSAVDHAAMRQIQAAVQAVLIGAGSLRATQNIWYPNHLMRFVVSRSGRFQTASRFFSDAPVQAFVVCPSGVFPPLPPGVRLWNLGEGSIDLCAMLARMRHELGIERLLVEGGSETNAAFLALDCVDELFLTIAPKVKLGRDTPTYAGGEALVRDAVQLYRLVSSHTVGNEVFLRYRRSIEARPDA